MRLLPVSRGKYSRATLGCNNAEEAVISRAADDLILLNGGDYDAGRGESGAKRDQGCEGELHVDSVPRVGSLWYRSNRPWEARELSLVCVRGMAG